MVNPTPPRPLTERYDRFKLWHPFPFFSCRNLPKVKKSIFQIANLWVRIKERELRREKRKLEEHSAMSETESTVTDPPKSEETPKEQTSSSTADSLSFNIWPPTNRTRDAVVRRLVETLTTDSVLSKRYGSVSTEEAEESARLIEQEAFTAAHAEHESRFGSGSGSNSVEEGIEILQVYSKEVSRRMLEFSKSRAEKAAPAPAPSEVGTE